MKKLLGIVVLGLLLSGNAYSAITVDEGICVHKSFTNNNYYWVKRIKGGKIKTLTWDTTCPNANFITKNEYPTHYKKLKKLIKKNKEGWELEAEININSVLSIIKTTHVYQTLASKPQSKTKIKIQEQDTVIKNTETTKKVEKKTTGPKSDVKIVKISKQKNKNIEDSFDWNALWSSFFEGKKNSNNFKIKKENKKVSKNDTLLKCVASGQSMISIVVNPDIKKIIFNGYPVKTPIIWGDIIYFMNPDPNVYNSKYSSHKEVKLNRITGELLTPTSSIEFDHLFNPRFKCSKAKALF